VSRRVKTVLAVLAATVASGALALPAQARPPKSFFGIQAWEAPDDKGFSNLQQGKFGVYRQLLFWSIVEETPGARKWDYFDAVVKRAARKRVPVLAVVVDRPDRIRRWFELVDELTPHTGLVTSEMVPAFAPTGPRLATLDAR